MPNISPLRETANRILAKNHGGFGKAMAHIRAIDSLIPIAEAKYDSQKQPVEFHREMDRLKYERGLISYEP